MASNWSIVVRMNKDLPVVRVAPSGVVGCNLKDWFDETNRRYNSGVVSSSFLTADVSTPISWAAHSGGARTSGETLAAVVGPPNFNAVNDAQYINSGADVAAGTSIVPNYKNVCAVNYGQPGPSALMTPDGTIQFSAVDLTLSSNAFTDVVSDLDVTVAGKLTATGYSTRTNYDPYADNGGTSYTVNLAAGPWAAKYFTDYTPWGQVLAATASGYYAYVLQIQTIVTQYYPGPSGQQFQPMLAISNPRLPWGQSLVNTQLPIPLVGSMTNNLVDNWTYVFAANAFSGNTIDANATRVSTLDITGAAIATPYNLCNIGVVLPDGADGTAVASVTYKVKTNTGL